MEKLAQLEAALERVDQKLDAINEKEKKTNAVIHAAVDDDIPDADVLKEMAEKMLNEKSKETCPDDGDEQVFMVRCAKLVAPLLKLAIAEALATSANEVFVQVSDEHANLVDVIGMCTAADSKGYEARPVTMINRDGVPVRYIKFTFPWF